MQVEFLIYFCCHIMGNKNTPVTLPLESPFFLLAYGGASCQSVKGARSWLQWVFYDADDMSFESNRYAGAVPYWARSKYGNHKIYYCYYVREYSMLSYRSC